MSKINVAVFASGTGSNFEAIMEAGDLSCNIVLLICDNPGATVIQKAEKYQVPTFVFRSKDYVSKEEYEKVLVEKLKEANISWVFLAGYMRIIGSTLLEAYEGRIINIHPSLLPDFPGKDAIGQAYHARVKTTGVTVHYVDAGIDTGPIIAQEEIEVKENDTLESLEEKIHHVEHQLYPRVMKDIVKK